MKAFRLAAVLVLSSLLSFGSPAFGQRHSGSRSSAARPNYGGGKHTQSHGGRYQGETNSHHKGGHYKNPASGDRYGKHKP
jgi:hypothetical protein